MSNNVQMEQIQTKENLSRQAGYRELGPAIWYKAGAKKFTYGEEKNEDNQWMPRGNRGSQEIFDVNDYNRKVELFKENKISRDERMFAGWAKEFVDPFNNYLSEKQKSIKENRRPDFAEIITASQFAAIKSVPKLVVVVSAEQRDHNLLDSIRVEGLDDFNGIKILDIADIGDDLLQEQGEFTIPRDIPGIEMTSQEINFKRWGFRTAFSYEIGMIRVDVQNLDNLLLQLLSNKVDLKRQKDVAAIINAQSSEGSQANWTTLSATDHFVNRAIDDITESLTIIADKKIGRRAQTIAMHPNVYTALYRNISLLSPPGVQLYPPQTYREVYSEYTTIPAFPNQRILQDDLLTTNRYFVYHRDAIWQLYGGLRTVPFENREMGYYGTNFRTYFNTVKVDSRLISGATGVLS